MERLKRLEKTLQELKNKNKEEAAKLEEYIGWYKTCAHYLTALSLEQLKTLADFLYYLDCDTIDPEDSDRCSKMKLQVELVDE